MVLANLKGQTPTEVLKALQEGLAGIDKGDSQSKTESILRCIDYSHSNLSPEAQGLLTCLAPFMSVINAEFLPQYTERLRQQPSLAHLPFDRWPDVLKEAVNWGLLSPHPDVPSLLRLQPIFPYFLRTRLHAPEQAETRRAVEAAFHDHYDDLSAAIYQSLKSKDAVQKQWGQALAGLEFENIATALSIALESQISILSPYRVLSNYVDTTQDHRRGLELGEMVLARLKAYPADKLAGRLGAEFAGVLDNIAGRQLSLKQYTTAEATYRRALSMFMGLTFLGEKEKAVMSAGIYHQLGMVAQEQRQWAQAEQHYREALTIYIEFNDRYAQARTYHQLGRVAQEQRQWQQAREYFLQSLVIFVEDIRTPIVVALALRSLARIWKASGDATLPATVAPICASRGGDREVVARDGLEEE